MTFINFDHDLMHSFDPFAARNALATGLVSDGTQKASGISDYACFFICYHFVAGTSVKSTLVDFSKSVNITPITDELDKNELKNDERIYIAFIHLFASFFSTHAPHDSRVHMT